jgi:hypothetical protein
MKNLSGQVGVYRRSHINQSALFLSINPMILIGEVFGKWTVVENDWYISSKKYTDRACLVSCQCGIQKVISYRSLRARTSSSCLSCRPKPERSIETVWTCLYNIYRQRGVVCKRDFHLTLPALKIVSLLPCSYCGREPSNLFRRKYKIDGKYAFDPAPGMTLRYSGLDRIDSEKGYVHGNVVPCCWECNKIKSALPLDVFLALIARIQKHDPTIDGVLHQAATLFDR